MSERSKLSVGPHDLTLKGHSKILICGGSGSGKTSICYKLLKYCNEMLTSPPKKIYYFYQLPCPIFQQMRETLSIPIEFIKNVPTDELLDEIMSSPLSSKLVCLDDIGMFLNKSIANLFAVGSHHGSIHLILILQNLFGKNKYTRDISLSCTQVN